MNGNGNATGDLKAVAWDPKSPASLLVPTVIDGSGDDDDAGQKEDSIERISGMVMNYKSCDDGAGCNSFESSAIMNMLDARDDYLEKVSSDASMIGSNHHRALLSLSKAYRKALSNCLVEWSEDIEKQKLESQETENGTEVELQEQERDLLTMTCSFLHLSSIFLLLPSRQGDSSMDLDGGFMYEDEIMGLPGAATADTVRYLRLHFLGDAAELVDPVVLDELYEVLAPDMYGDEYDGTDDGGRGNLYWELIEGYVVRGCLEEAWALLSHHSLVGQFKELEEEEDTLSDYRANSLAQDREGFRALKNILLSGPLPGGRNNRFDEGFDFDEARSGAGDAEEEELFDGISTFAYRLWETSSEHDGSIDVRAGDYAVRFEPNAARQVHYYWKQAIDGLPALKRLRQRIPQLNRLLTMMCGNFRDINFGSWQEEFCAELLYKNPTIRLEDIHVRVAALMQKHKADDDANRFDETILTIMKGNAGEAVSAMHSVGGNSGAALPAVMTSLLLQLLADAKVLEYNTENTNYSTELLIRASSAIRSSLGMEGHCDLGTRLAVRLLLPHIEIDSDLRITATLVNTLEHHFPKTDSEAKILLSLCRNLVERKNVRVLDGCVSICLARHLFYIGKNIPGGAVHWLLTGIEFESLVLCDRPKRSGDWQKALASGVCYRKLVAYFTGTSQSFLKGLLGEEKGASLYYARSGEMIAATKEDSPNHINNLASFVPAVNVLENIFLIAGAIVEGKDDSVVASSIVSCLEERPDDEDDGVVSSLARSLNWDLFRLGVDILKRDAENANNTRSISSFDPRGMGVLLSVFTVETKARELRSQNEVLSEAEDKELRNTRLILAEGLKRAFVAENSMKKTAMNRRKKASVEGICSPNFSKYSREQQEEAVQRMLEY